MSEQNGWQPIETAPKDAERYRWTRPYLARGAAAQGGDWSGVEEAIDQAKAKENK